ncbi:MAG: acetate/propionate family kinase [Steroidobacteraceae bacterium]
MTHVLTLNGGSSSIKFGLHHAGVDPRRILAGKIERIGLSGTSLTFVDSLRNQHGNQQVAADSFESAVGFLVEWLDAHVGFANVKAVGHRVVHGMEHRNPELLTPPLLEELRSISQYDPEHLPGEIRLIEAFIREVPALPQVLCFDTAFHQTMPRVATLLPIPRRYQSKGIRRYGFHGLSYSYLMHALTCVAGEQAATGKVILAHLGNGASMAAVRNGKGIDTTMGFTPSGGLPMGTRSGDLDPGVIWYLAQIEKLSPQQLSVLINQQSGLLGMSGLSSDMRDLLAHEEHDAAAAEAIDLFCYQARKSIGAFAAALGGLETLVFSGGIGEHLPPVRGRICQGLQFLGIELDAELNAVNADVISAQTSRVAVRVIPTDEEWMMARFVCQTLGLDAVTEQG